ncbi:MAG: hypothetical protein WKF62_03885, partial [Solirubrobacterales bacterium]
MTRAKRDETTTVPPEVERELEALDAALRGAEVPAGMEGLEALVSDLRAERPEADPLFEAELDVWAAEGFPRGERPGSEAADDGAGGSGTGGFFSRFGPGGSRGWALVAATAATLLVVAVSISQVGDFGGDEGADTTQVASDAGRAKEAPQEEAFGAAPAARESDAGLDDAGAGGSTDLLGPTEDSASLNSQRLERNSRALVPLASDARGLAGGLSEASRSGVNRGQEKRRVDRDAELTLAAPAEEVPDVTNEVIDVT